MHKQNYSNAFYLYFYLREGVGVKLRIPDSFLPTSENLLNRVQNKYFYRLSRSVGLNILIRHSFYGLISLDYDLGTMTANTSNRKSQ